MLSNLLGKPEDPLTRETDSLRITFTNHRVLRLHAFDLVVAQAGNGRVFASRELVLFAQHVVAKSLERQ
jgi:hypothetical protein